MTKIYILYEDDGDGWGIEEISNNYKKLVERAGSTNKSRIYEVDLSAYTYIDDLVLNKLKPIYITNEEDYL